MSRKKLRLSRFKTSCVAIAGMVLTTPAFAGMISDYTSLDAALDYNAFILEDMIDYSTDGSEVTETDIEGAVAVGGSIRQTDPNDTTSLTVGLQLSKEPGYDGSVTALVVRGDAENQDNRIHGSVYVGGNADFDGGLGIEGNVTVGGDLNYNTNGVGGNIGQSPETFGDGNVQVLVGGDATFGDGSNVYGTVQANGGITVNGDGMGNTSALIVSDEDINNTVTHNVAGYPYLEDRKVVAADASIPSSPVDFVTLVDNGGLVNDSKNMATLTTTAGATVSVDTFGDGFGGLVLDATGATPTNPNDAIVFNLGPSPNLWTSGFTIDADTASEIIINISGDTHILTDFAFFIDPILDFKDIVFNFFEATSITLGESLLGDVLNPTGIGFDGILFAPMADVYFNNGLLRGNLIAKNLYGTGQINWLGEREEEELPTPPALTLILLGLFMMSFIRWRNAQAIRVRITSRQ